jgi:hypothetical protein
METGEDSIAFASTTSIAFASSGAITTLAK